MRLAACSPLPTRPVPATHAAMPVVLLGSHLQTCFNPARPPPVADAPGLAGQQRGTRNPVAIAGRVHAHHLPMAGVQQRMHMLDCVQRAEPRNALYMAALAAIRRNPPLAAFYKRVRDRGNQPKLALVAVMRKLVALAGALLRADRLWTPSAPCAQVPA